MITKKDLEKKRKETLDAAVNGRVYRRYKKYIDDNEINVGQLVMAALDNIEPKLKNPK